jgi:hypothetical protein
MRLNLWQSLFGMLLISIALAGCGQVDRRLTEDRQTCTAMGHSTDTAEFQQCMAELNSRRCANTAVGKTGSHHVATLDCTRLGSP